MLYLVFLCRCSSGGVVLASHIEDWHIRLVSDIINTLTGIAIWWCYIVLDFPSVRTKHNRERNRPFVHAFSWAVASGLLSVLAICLDYAINWSYFGIATGGIYNGLALACLAGRFSSAYMNVPRPMIITIYGYALLAGCLLVCGGPPIPAVVSACIPLCSVL